VFSVKKVTASGEHHGQAKFIAGLDRVSITKAAAWMDDGLNSMACGKTHGVIEREEAITGEHSPHCLLTSSL
jgi:hypothetical protein